ncbi:MAG: ATP synthase F1 subunit delta [Atopobiaceae bacterium]|nr:ATP synthase F1 subunit delta [Atopobiaceae bacterium]MBQ9316355.1 ATP synthase F1 subunit delta [Atopobiaceae bacterium]
MAKSRIEQKRTEVYARVLHEAAKEAGRIEQDLDQLEVLSKLTPEVLETLTVIFEEGDVNSLADVLATFKALVDTDDTTIPVTVTTAVPLDDELRNKIIAQAQKDFGAEVFLVEKVDPEILGGIIVETRNSRRDASVRAQLTNIKSNLSAAIVGGDTQ